MRKAPEAVDDTQTTHENILFCFLLGSDNKRVACHACTCQYMTHKWRPKMPHDATPFMGDKRRGAFDEPRHNGRYPSPQGKSRIESNKLKATQKCDNTQVILLYGKNNIFLASHQDILPKYTNVQLGLQEWLIMAVNGKRPTPMTRLEPESSLKPCAFTFTRQASRTTSSTSIRAHSGIISMRSSAASL